MRSRHDIFQCDIHVREICQDTFSSFKGYGDLSLFDAQKFFFIIRENSQGRIEESEMQALVGY